MSVDRQTGATTGQMRGAPHGAVFMWCNHDLHYPRALAHAIGRSDLVVVSPNWLQRNCRGYRGPLVVDHAFTYLASYRERDALARWQAWARQR